MEEDLSDENTCDVLVIANVHSNGDFRDKMVDYMVDRKVSLTSDQWATFCDEHPNLAI